MEYITVGYVANTHGLRGEVKIKPQTDFAVERFAKGATLLLELEDGMISLSVSSAYAQKGMIVAKFDSYDDINTVEPWKGKRLVITKAELPKLDEDEIYYHDLMHLQVEDETGAALGEVVEIIETGAHEIIRVRGDKEVLIPYVKTFIKEVKLAERKLIVHLLDGMV